MDLVSILVQLVGGAAGGSASGKTIRSADLGPLWNAIAGAIGGLGGGSITAALGGAAGGLDVASIATQLLGSGLGGVVLQAIVGLVKNKLVGK